MKSKTGNEKKTTILSSKNESNDKLMMDAESLIDQIDTFQSSTHKASSNSHDHSSTSTTSNTSSTTSNTNSSNHPFDPIKFLNHHYKTEQALVNALPSLRSTLKKRISTLDESISNTIQQQSETASTTLASVTRAKTAVSALYQRVASVQEKARQSETAVQEITRDMKRLDYAKQHLSKTITTLKRLHMLSHAVIQLRHCVRVCDPPDYANAANLVDATSLLMGHFKIYEEKVEKMKILKHDIDSMRNELEEGIIFSFWVVGFGTQSALERRERDMVERKKKEKLAEDSKRLPPKTVEEEMAENAALNSSMNVTKHTSPLTPQELMSACLVIDALGLNHRTEFLKGFCHDHLEAYVQLFHPKNNASAGGGNVATSNQKPSFKIILSSDKDASTSFDAKENSATSNPNQASLDQIERRYAWYRRMLRELDETFPNVFPKYWNIEYNMTHSFLIETGKHILLLFSSKDGAHKHLRDRDCDNVTILLKALQKTMLFEKEMTAWLQREYGTKFFDDDDDENKKQHLVGEDGEPLEFDEAGNAVAAGSAEGIRIKYERRMNERKKREEQELYKSHNGVGDDGTTDVVAEELLKTNDEANKISIVAPLIGLASNHFEKYMGPYIALEEQNMDDQLKESASDKTVDTRGSLPVVTSSTNLFLYIKNSITRCTTLTKGKTLFLLYRAFQRILRKYAKLLEHNFPSTMSGPAAMIGGLSIAGLTSGISSGGLKDVYRIPAGEEVTICHAIDTCDYCVDTIEALQDLIIDKIVDKYKEKIDMSGEEEAFHDVAATGIRVLVSGLIQRTDQEFKKMCNFDWATLEGVGEESSYVRAMHSTIQPFVLTVKNTLPNSYFRNFCDQFAMAFTNAFYNTITRCKRINETGTQQLLLDVYNIKTLLLKLPVLENDTGSASSPGKSSAIAPAIYTKMVANQFQRIEILLKLVGTPSDLLIDNFKVQWQGGSAMDLQTIMNLKGIKRNEQATLFEKFGVDPSQVMKGAPLALNDMQKVQALKDQSSDVAAKVNNDLVQMRQKVEEFRKAFR